MIDTIHFICKGDLHIEHLPDGTFLTGVWRVSRQTATEARRIALHRSRAEPSFLQGIRLKSDAKMVDGQVRFTFRVTKDDQKVDWPQGGGAGEKAYTRV